MLAKYAVLAAAAAAAVTAAPVVEKRAAAGQADIDVVILNYALTLEHLENAFYRDTLATYDAAAFRAAGYPDWVRQRFIEIGAWVSSAVQLGDAFPRDTNTPLNFNQTYSLAAPLITSCPNTNPALPVKAFPAATVSGDVCGGKQVTISGDGVQPGQYAAFLAGLQVYYAQIGDGNSVTVPEGVGYGRIYAVVSRVGDSIADDNIVAGPAVIDIPLSAEQAA
ncbi:hypothetical protein NDA16_003754 [Ustilago loliicola]|nr:hypothetical protein NDA16_003754 [Ustilago loliicola]